MKIDFQETTDDLAKRIDIHSRYGSKDIDAWMLEVLNLEPAIKILDIGCGSGKQCFSFFHHLNGNAEITGTDVSESLLDDAREKNKAIDNAVEFKHLDFNQKFETYSAEIVPRNAKPTVPHQIIEKVIPGDNDL